MERKPKDETSGFEHNLSKNVDGKNKVKPNTNKLKDCINNDKKDGTKRDSEVGLVSQISITNGKLFQPKEKSISNSHAERKDKGKHKVSDVTNKHMSKKGKKDEKRKEKAVEMEKDLESDDFETPSMSFEEYLSYDHEAPKRKKRACESKNPKRIKVDLRQDAKICHSSTNSRKSITEAPTTVVSIE